MSGEPEAPTPSDQTAAPAAPAVFISHSSKDAAIANALCKAIEDRGVPVWIAPRNVAAGRHYAESILDGINGSKVMVLVFSSQADESEQVLREVERAVSKKLPIITMRVEDAVPTRAMEYFLSSHHWLDAFKGPIEPHLQTVADVVRQYADAGFARSAPTSPLIDFVQPVSPYHISRRTALIGASALSAAAVAGGAWWLLSPKGVDGVVLDPSAVAVLPFDNLTGDTALDYLTRAMPDELGRLLTALTSVAVRPFAEVQRIAQAAKPGDNTGLALGVGRVVNGSLSQGATGLTLALTINDPVRRQQMWTDSLAVADPTHLADLMALVVAKVGAVVQKNIDVERARASIDCREDQAYVLYLRAISLQQEINRENIDLAIQHLQRATEADSQFARAFAALAECYVTSFYWGLSERPGPLPQARTAAERATELRPDLAESHYALAVTLEASGKRKEAIGAYFVSLRANPRYADAIKSVAKFLFYMADFDRSIEMWERLARIDATSNTPRLRKAMCYYFKGDAARAKTENAAAERFARGVDEFTLIAFVYVWLDDIASANRMLERLKSVDPAAIQINEVQAWILTKTGDFKGARAQIDKIVARFGDYYGIQDEIATFYAIQGNREEAIKRLAAAVAAGAPNYAWYRSDWFKALRGDVRYETIVNTLADEYAQLKPLIPNAK